jgi:hypothetical protein
MAPIINNAPSSFALLSMAPHNNKCIVVVGIHQHQSFIPFKSYIEGFMQHAAIPNINVIRYSNIAKHTVPKP